MRRSRLTERLDLHDALRAFTGSKRLRACGRWRITAGEGVTLHVGTTEEGERVSYLTNVQRCGSPWICPTCGPKIRQGRAGEIERAALSHIEAGGALYTMVVTLPHDAPDRLAETWRVLSEGYKRMMGGAGWRSDCGRFGVEGYVRSSEVTHGRHGWHPHAHPLLFTDRMLSPAELVELADRLHGRWCRYVVSQGFRPPARHLCRLYPVRSAEGVAAYVVKAGLGEDEGPEFRLGLEIARGDMKRGGRTRSPWEIAAAAAGGSEPDRLLWREWERESKGKRSVTWSRGLKGRYAVKERADEELAREEAETAAAERLEIEPGDWEILSAKRGAQSTLRLIAELLGIGAAAEFVAATRAAHIEARVGALFPEGIAAGRAPPDDRSAPEWGAGVRARPDRTGTAPERANRTDSAPDPAPIRPRPARRTGSPERPAP